MIVIVSLLHAGWQHRQLNQLLIVGTTDALVSIAAAIGSSCSIFRQVNAAGSEARPIRVLWHSQLTLLVGKKAVNDNRRNDKREDAYCWAYVEVKRVATTARARNIVGKAGAPMVKPPVYNMTRACSDKKCAARPLGRGWVSFMDHMSIPDVVVNNHSHSWKAENDDEFWQLHLYLPSLSFFCLVDEKHSSVLQLISYR